MPVRGRGKGRIVIAVISVLGLIAEAVRRWWARRSEGA